MSVHKMMAVGMIAMLSAACPLAAGQAGQGHTAVQQPANQVDDGSLTIQFRGGSLAEYIKTVERAAGEGVNIVVSGPAGDVRLEPIGLRSVDVETALQVAVNMSQTLGGFSPEHHVRLQTLAGPLSDVHHVQVQMQHRAVTSRARQETEVILLRELLKGGMEPQTVLSAVEAALMADGDAEEPVLRFHEPSSLLIVRGTIPQVVTVTKVIEQLGRSALAERRERERDTVQQEILEVRSRLESLNETESQLQKEVDEGRESRRFTSTDEAQAFQTKQHQLISELNQVRQHITTARQTLSQLGSRHRELSPPLTETSPRVRELEAEVARLRAELAALTAKPTPAGR